MASSHESGLLSVVPARMHLKRADVQRILQRAQAAAKGREVFVVILCLGHDTDIADLFDAFDGNVAITTTSEAVLADRARYNRLADRIVREALQREGLQLYNLDGGLGGGPTGQA